MPTLFPAMKREDALDDIAELIHRVEPNLPRLRILQVVARTVAARPAVSKLLSVLQNDIGLLTSADNTMPSSLGTIINQLIQDGATTLKHPRCHRCHEERTLRNRLGAHGICAACYSRDRRVHIECSRCGQRRKRRAVVDGQEWCGTCWEGQLGQVAAVFRSAVLGSGCGITARQFEAVAATVHSTWKAGDILRLSLELNTRSEQWFAQPAAGSVLFLRFHAALEKAGVMVTPVACGRCGREATLAHILGGLRCCARCYSASKREACSQCGRDQILVLHAADGTGICQTCMKKLPDRMATCIECGQRRYVAWNGPDGPVCSKCRPKHRIDYCPGCKRQKPCLFAGTSRARCHECSRQKESCALCGTQDRAATRNDQGIAICGRCSRKPEPCSDCGRHRIVVGRAQGKPLCDYCYPKDPVSFRDCGRCGRHENLQVADLCQRCAANDELERLVPLEVRANSPVAQAIHDLCLDAKPQSVLAARRNSSMGLLRSVMDSQVIPTHEFLDDAGADQATRAVRSLLVDAGLLPYRDNNLARFEEWIIRTAQRITDPQQRAAFVQFARWRHVRELRKRTSPVHSSLTTSRRRELRLVMELLEWLQHQNRVLVSLTQSDVDRWRASGSAERHRVKPFLAWAHANGMVRSIEILRKPGSALDVAGTPVDERVHLLHGILDPGCTLPVAVRFASALVLLFGAGPQQIVELRVSDISAIDERVYLKLGNEPLLLPDALVDLAIGTQQNRKAPRLFAPTRDTDWLFPGIRTGYPLAASTLIGSMKLLGVSASRGRTGAMAALAQELPPAILARLTGNSTATAVRWSNAVAASNARYAALAMPATPLG